MRGKVEDEGLQDRFFVKYQTMDLNENDELAGWHDNGNIPDIKIDPLTAVNRFSQAGNILPRIAAQVNQPISSSFLAEPLYTYIRSYI